jgi:3-oxocholest-4-en-26-oyl-CoA dehydrogenase alpha subunit
MSISRRTTREAVDKIAALAGQAGSDGRRLLDDKSVAYRLACPTGIYGGTLEVFRNTIAEHALGLGRPNCSPPAF